MDRSDLDGRPARRRAPDVPEQDELAANGHARARRPGDLGPTGYDEGRRGRHGADGYDRGTRGEATDRNGVDRYGSDRHAAHGRVSSRHGAGERDDHDGYEPGNDGSRYRPDGYARARHGSDDVERSDRGYLGRALLDPEPPEYTPDEFGPDGYDPGARDPDEYAHDEYENGFDDARTARLPVGGLGTGRRRAPDPGGRDVPAAGEHDGGRESPATDDDDSRGDTVAEAPDRESPRRRARTGRGGERPTRRRRWPWVVGGVAAAAAVVSIGLAVLGGTDEQRGPSRAGSVAGLGTSSGNGQPGAAPSAASAAPQPAAAQVTYEVTGSGSASTITFARGTSVAQTSDTDLPWKKTGPAVEGPAEYTLTAAGDSGEIACKILIDGVVLAEDSADGDSAAVSCSGRR